MFIIKTRSSHFIEKTLWLPSGCRFCPSSPRMRGRPDCHYTGSCLDFDVIRQPSNLQQRLGEPYPSRITDFDQLPSNHGHLRQACSHCSNNGARFACPSSGNTGHHLAAENRSGSISQGDKHFAVAGQVNGRVREWQHFQEQAEEGSLMSPSPEPQKMRAQ